METDPQVAAEFKENKSNKQNSNKILLIADTTTKKPIIYPEQYVETNWVVHCGKVKNQKFFFDIRIGNQKSHQRLYVLYHIIREL